MFEVIGAIWRVAFRMVFRMQWSDSHPGRFWDALLAFWGRRLPVALLFLGVFSLGTLLLGVAWAEPGHDHSCCCDAMPNAGMHKMSTKSACAMAGTPHDGVRNPVQAHLCFGMGMPLDCQCQIEQGQPLPSEGALALTSSTVTFAVATAHIPFPQINIPLARAPDAPPIKGFGAYPPPEPIYLLNRTLLI